MGVTLKDIAEHVGVDRSTVSRVLRNKGAEIGISQALAERISLAARELNYVPNTSARAVRMGRFNCAGLLLSTNPGASYLPTRLLDGIHDELVAADMHLSVAKIPDAKLRRSNIAPKVLRELMADGLLINYTHQLPRQLSDALALSRLPVIWINTSNAMDGVATRSRDAARALTERFIALGHRRIAYVDLCHGRLELGDQHYSALDRLAGYRDAMAHAGLPSREIVPDRACLSHGPEMQFIAPVLRRDDRPTAIVCYFAVFVPSILRACAEQGLRVPADLSIAAFAAEAYHDAGVTVDCMVEPHYEMGRLAVQSLNQRINDPSVHQPTRWLEFSLVDMGTSGPPPGSDVG